MKDLLKVNPEIEKQQVKKLTEVKDNRDNSKVKETLILLKQAAENPDKNVMPFILDCVKSYATLGEICDQLRDVFGEYKDSIKI